MNEYNDKKICFIFCTNNEQYEKECMLYLSLLNIPEDYTMEILTIKDAKSIASGYNEGMISTDAKYKVYLHQDTFITEPFFIQKILDIFRQDRNIGIVGLMGAEKLSKDGVMWHEDRCGDFYRLDELLEKGDYGIEKLKEGIREVDVVDGYLIATQYDIPWRDDIIREWDFYDVSQCLEFKRRKYKVVVPAQNPTWAIHACGIPSYWRYEKNRQIMIKEYPEIWQGKDYLRILFLHSTQISILGIAYSLMSLGHNITIPDYQVTLGDFLIKDVEKVEELLEEGHYDMVVTYDFCSGVAYACDKKKVKYYAWVYDSPLLELYTDCAKSPNNYISVFDKKQYERMKEFGIPNLYHIPLCSEVDVFGTTNITKEDEKKYVTDISFVGRLYDNRGYAELFDEQDLQLKEEFDAIAGSCKCIWDGKTTVYDKASEKLIEHIVNKLDARIWEFYHMSKRFYCESMKLAGRCNEIERVTILNKLAEKFTVTLYSDDSPKDMLHGIILKPWVDYWEEMPKVFHLSKINLNITSRSIESGIPQRVWDILAVGGFCLTNYQPEIQDYFEIGKDLEVYHDLDELMEKAEYYLKHENKRIRIAINGYKKVRSKHKYNDRLKEMLKYIVQ